MPLTPLREPAVDLGTPPWHGFQDGPWQTAIDVRDFIQRNYEPYEGDGTFLVPATMRTKHPRSKVKELFAEERRTCVVDVSDVLSTITAHAPGYIDRTREIIVGLQTEAPLERAVMPMGTLGTKVSDGVFDAYTADVRRCRSSHILTGLPDT